MTLSIFSQSLIFSAFFILSAAVDMNASPSAGGNMISDDNRVILNLAGTWEACSADWTLSYPPPQTGWMPHQVPHQETNLLDSDDIGPYFPKGPEVIFEADNKTPKRKDKLAAWFRRSFTIANAEILDGKRAILFCDGIAWYSEIWLNGTKVGESKLGMAPNAYDVSKIIVAGENQLLIGVAGRVRLWDPDNKTFVAPIAGAMPGIWNSVRLEILPELRIDDVFIRTYVSKKRIEADITIVNESQTPQTCATEIKIFDPQGLPCLSLSGKNAVISPGEKITTTLSADWLPDNLWSPGTPNIHRAETTLCGSAGGLDKVRTSFGFREFTTQGYDFLLNGRRQVLLRNSWLTQSGAPRNKVLPNVREELVNYNCIRLHLFQTNPHVIDQANTTGLMVIPEFWGFYQNQNKQFPITKRVLWLPNTIETVKRVVKQYRNNPSVIMWSITNETFWDSVDPEHMEVADALIKAVRSVDSTRILQADAELSYEGRLETINIHYPEGDTGTVSKKYPNSGWVIPNDFAWLKKGEMNQSWRAKFIWDRPLMIGEYFCQDGDSPERYAPYAGDEAYDFIKWNWQAMGGRDAIMPREDNAWIKMVKMATDHYRAAGVACLNPWTGIGRQLMPQFLLAPLDYHPSAFGGKKFQRRFIVANDSFSSYNEIHLQAGLFWDGRELWCERKIPCHVEPGEKKEVTISILPPNVKARIRARLIVRMCWMRGAWPYELARHEEDSWIVPSMNLSEIDPNAIVLVDSDDKLTSKALGEINLPLSHSSSDDSALSGKKLLIIGEEAISRADLEATLRFVENGGSVIVLRQSQIPPFFPDQPQVDPMHATSFSWKKVEHPILLGLDEGQLRFWRPDHLVATETMIRPSTGLAVPISVSGGRYGLNWSPLIELKHGKGLVIFCQYILASRVSVEPAARTILCQTISHALKHKAKSVSPLNIASPISKECKVVLEACRIKSADVISDSGPILLDLAQDPNPNTIKRIKDEVAKGRILWLRGINKKNATQLSSLLPWQPDFSPIAKDIVWAVRRSNNPFMAGICSEDLYWPRFKIEKNSLSALIPPAISSDIVLLTEPALLLAVRLGKGWILIDQMPWEKALTAEMPRVMRLVSALARNSGADFKAAVDISQRYNFTTVNIAKFANRGYVDEVPGDGVGGWTDQGENDMRWFLTNHVGTADGVIGGMAVASAPFPTSVKFQGVPFNLIDPKANKNKAVITLCGKEADQASPKEVRGIPVNKKADTIWFLHTAAWSSAPGVEVAKYEVVYSDGERMSIPIRQGQEVADWWNPQAITNAQIAWTGKNLKTSLVGIYVMSWDNPKAEKTISTIDIIGSLSQTQVILLGITLGTAKNTERRVAVWDCGQFLDGKVMSSPNVEALTGSGSIVNVGDKLGLRLANGQNISGRLPTPNPLEEGKPLIIEIELAPDDKPSGHFGGLIECGKYQNAGLRILLDRDLNVVVEHWAGKGAENAVYLKSKDPIPVGRFRTVRYEYDGQHARLLINGQVQEIKECPPPAPYKDGTIRIGLAAGKDYFFNGIIGRIAVYYKN